MTATDRVDVGTVEDLRESASRMTGLSDFGPDDYSDGLAVILESYARDADLTPLGSKVARVGLRGALAARLLSEAAWADNPRHADVPIDRPIFVTGLPRSGTTALHRLLTADPGHQGLELWLAEMPQPRPSRDSWDANPVFQAIQAGYQQHHVEHPEFMGVHYIAADTVEECWQLLRQTLRSVSYECLAHLPTYSDWLQGQDWTGPFRRHRRNLQMIGLNEPDKRWVLKNPSHLFSLDAIMAVYPDALIIQTHRAPRTSVGSMCSLAAHATDGWSNTFRGPVIGAGQLELWARGLAEFAAARARYSPAQFLDVDYADFTADPVATVESVYAHFGLPYSDDAATAVRGLHAAAGAGDARPSHRYSLADFGLTGEQVDERFGGDTRG
jgi:Sulfotransferase family